MTHHHFTPAGYHRALGTCAPALTVEPGDSITTTCLDCRGRDAGGEQVADSGNPLTGPFAVAGAVTGDVLAVTLDSLRPNRDWGHTSGCLAPHVLDPYGPRPPRRESPLRWNIDVDAGIASTLLPDSPIRTLRLPLDPMIGCFGVAPRGGQTISAATSERHGGNMDYRGFRAGATVFLPVFAAGALFFIGDGHAIQGDGEITGNGIEVSFDVTFTLDLLPQWSINWPRAVDTTHLMTVGNARPLEQALQHATSEMLIWLGELGLGAGAAGIVLGQSVAYDVGNVYDPAYTMVCKVPRRLLADLGVETGVGEPHRFRPSSDSARTSQR